MHQPLWQSPQTRSQPRIQPAATVRLIAGRKPHELPVIAIDAASRRRRRAAAAAGHAGDRDGAVRYLSDPNPSVRASALSAVERAGGLTNEMLASAMVDPEPAVRIRALELAAERGRTPSGWSILPLLDDPDDLVVEVAAWACGECLPAPPSTVERLAAIVRSHPDPLAREAAVASLGAIGDPSALAEILAACREKPAIRRRAVLALAPFEGPEVDEALRAALADRDWQVRQAAEDILGR